MSMIQFTHNLMSGPKEKIPAMNRVKQILKNANFTNRVFPMCIGYASWETDEVITMTSNFKHPVINFWPYGDPITCPIGPIILTIGMCRKITPTGNHKWCIIDTICNLHISSGDLRRIV